MKESRSERTNGEENKSIEMERLEERRRARRWLNCEGMADLRFRKLLFYERDLFNRGEVNRGAFDRIGCDAKP